MILSKSSCFSILRFTVHFLQKRLNFFLFKKKKKKLNTDFLGVSQIWYIYNFFFKLIYKSTIRYIIRKICHAFDLLKFHIQILGGKE